MQDIRHLLSLSALLLFSRSTLSSGETRTDGIEDPSPARSVNIRTLDSSVNTKTFSSAESPCDEISRSHRAFEFSLFPLLIGESSTVPLYVLLRFISTSSAWRRKKFSPKSGTAFPVHAFLEPHEFCVAAGSEFFSRCVRGNSFPFLTLRHQH
jgi:hypothetical protein